MTYADQTLIAADLLEREMARLEREQDNRPEVYRMKSGMWSWRAGLTLSSHQYGTQDAAFRSALRYAIRRARAKAEEFDDGW